MDRFLRGTRTAMTAAARPFVAAALSAAAMLAAVSAGGGAVPGAGGPPGGAISMTTVAIPLIPIGADPPGPWMAAPIDATFSNPMPLTPRAAALSPSGGGALPATRVAPIPGPIGTAPGVLFRWPLDGRPAVVSTFAPPPEPWLPGRRGVVLASGASAAVYAASAGVVTFAGRIGGIGVVTVTHTGGLRTTYEPVRPTVHPGDRVAAGTRLGWVDGRWSMCPATIAACLHWGLRRGDLYLDPLALLGLAEVRLFPS